MYLYLTLLEQKYSISHQGPINDLLIFIAYYKDFKDYTNSKHHERGMS